MYKKKLFKILFSIHIVLIILYKINQVYESEELAWNNPLRLFYIITIIHQISKIVSIQWNIQILVNIVTYTSSKINEDYGGYYKRVPSICLESLEFAKCAHMHHA